MFFNGSAAAGLTINLTGTVAAGDVYVVAQSTRARLSWPRRPDQQCQLVQRRRRRRAAERTPSSTSSARSASTRHPVGRGLVSTADNTLWRKASVCGAIRTAATRSFLPRVGRLRHGHLWGLGAHTPSAARPNQPVASSAGHALCCARRERRARRDRHRPGCTVTSSP